MAQTGSTQRQAGASGSLQVSEDMDLQRRTWRIERVGWIVMALVVLAALFGLFSTGPLSTATARDPAGLVSVEYDRFARHIAPSTLRVEVSAGAAAGDRIALRMNRDLAEAIRIEQMQPQPEQAKATPDGTIFVFNLAEQDQPGRVRFAIRPEAIGLLRGELGVAGQPPARLTQFVYP